MFREILIFILLLPFAVTAQTDTIFSSGEMITTRENATVYRPTPQKEGDKYKIVDYFISNNKVWREGYSYSIDSPMYDGYYTEYYEDGHKREYGNYFKGNKIGQWKLKYEDTDRLWAVINYIPGEVDTSNIATTYYRNGKVKRKEWNVKGKDVGFCYTETGEAIPFTPFQQMPEFPGDMSRFLGKTIRYPEQARESNIDGKVYVQFYVNEDGSLTVIKTKGPHMSLCKEAVRVVNLMPKWKPGKLDDKPAKVHFTIPVLFRLE